MQIRRILRAVFGVAGLLLIGAYFYMRVEHVFPDRIHDIWIVGMLCCWASVLITWRDRPKQGS